MRRRSQATALALLGLALAAKWSQLAQMEVLQPFLGPLWAQLGALLGFLGQLCALMKTMPEAAAAAVEELPPDVRSTLKGTLFISLPVSMVGVVGGILYKLYDSFYTRAVSALERHLKVSMTFSSRDRHYDEVLDYIGAKCAVNTGKLVASTQARSRPSFAEMLAKWLGGKQKTPTFYYQPEIAQFANCFVWVDADRKRHKIWVSRSVKEIQMRTDASSKQRDPETITLSIWWTTDSQPLKHFMTEALKTMLSEDSEQKVDIYVKHMWLPMWTKAISKERRDRETVVLDENLAESVMDDLRHFFTQRTADWYHNAGIPYRRGYLLHGPPGCGKTSFAQVLAGEMGLDVCLMNLSNHDMNDDDLAELLRNAPGRSMLLLEDVDAIFVERSAGDGKKGGISFSGLLNALDGAAAQEGCVIMLTTNHKDRLDDALIRPGRCDVHVHITNASQDQAKRMFYRFFAKEARVRSVDGSGRVTLDKALGLSPGDPVMYRRSGGQALACSGVALEDKRVLYAAPPHGPASAREQLALHASQADALAGGAGGLLRVEGGEGAILQCLPEAAGRFSGRIPERQVSMAKLQGYLMRQKLLAEQSFKNRRERAELPPAFDGLDPNDDEYKFLFEEDIRSLASEAAVLNVHELLDVKTDTDEVKVPIFDHLRRLGVHRHAPLFEHFGVRFKQDIGKELASRMEAWHPDLKIPGPSRDRLVALLNGEEKLDAAYALADLSVLRDRFMATFQAHTKEAVEEPRVDPPVPAKPQLVRSQSEPPELKGPMRINLLRQASLEKARPMNLLEMAHQFQEQLEGNGKTEVSMWQLDMHFQRFATDPVGAVETCARLLHGSGDRSPEERAVSWVTTFAFLRRLGLEQYAFALEDAGYGLWSELKALSKDELKDKGAMGDKDAALCKAILECSGERPDLLRKFQCPEFGDLADMFSLRFPEAPRDEGRRFALQLTDELGVTEFSCLQVQAYLDSAASPREALAEVSARLPTLAAAQAARARPEAPPPPKEPDDWVYLWLRAEGLEGAHGAFQGQALLTLEDVVMAPLDQAALKEMGVQKIGERSKILRMIERERGRSAGCSPGSQ